MVESGGKLNNMLRRCQDMAGFHNRESAYNLQNLRTGEDGEFSAGSLGTIESRQHRGTHEADEVMAWVEVATSMVRFAHKTALTGNMLSVVKGHAYGPQMGFDPFLRMMGVADKTVDYGLPEEVTSRLLREKHPPVGAASPAYRWSDWWNR